MSGTPADPKVFHGQEATVEIGDAIGTVDTSNTLAGLMSNQTDFSGRIMEISITDPEASVEVQNAFGGQVKVESPSELVEIEFTVRFKDTEFMEQLHGTSTEYTSGGNSWYRLSAGGGSGGTKSVGDKRNRAILFKLSTTVSGTTYTLHYLMNNAIFQQMGEISLEADGSAELTGTAVCLVDDRHIERNFS